MAREPATRTSVLSVTDFAIGVLVEYCVLSELGILADFGLCIIE